MPILTFPHFLRTIRERQDPVGDFARDFLRDPNAPLNARKVKTILAYLETVPHCSGVMEAAESAWAEWESLPPNPVLAKPVLAKPISAQTVVGVSAQTVVGGFS